MRIGIRVVTPLRASYKMAFEESGIPHTAQNFTDGMEARRFCGGVGNAPNFRPPDLILLDLNLGRCDGFDVLQTIRANTHLDATPVIVISTSQRGEDVMKKPGAYPPSEVPGGKDHRHGSGYVCATCHSIIATFVAVTPDQYADAAQDIDDPNLRAAVNT